ncbi:MAG: HAD hydrolase family protein [Pseudomonadota bacterium]|nr:HAD hydrolase family protein [Pseudomonadota bacterium]
MQTLHDKARAIRCLICDVDGVLTDGRIYLSAKGDEFKVFHAHDGIGIKMLIRSGIDVAIISARYSQPVQDRMTELGIRHIYQGEEHKSESFALIRHDLGLENHQIAYIGDDIIDLACIRAAGLGITVPNAMPIMFEHADWQTQAAGGAGAVREVAELILSSQDKLNPLHEAML